MQTNRSKREKNLEMTCYQLLINLLQAFSLLFAIVKAIEMVAYVRNEYGEGRNQGWSNCYYFSFSGATWMIMEIAIRKQKDREG